MDKNPLFDKYGTSIPSGTAIFREGEAGDRMYIIQSGVVRITKSIEGVEHTLADLQKGDFFGEMAIVSRLRRQATATAVGGSVQLLVFDRQGFEAMIGKNTQIAMNVIDKLSRRLQNANTQIQHLVRRNKQTMVAVDLLERFSTHSNQDGAMSLDRAVEEIALNLDQPADSVKTCLYAFVEENIISIDGNALKLRDESRLRAKAEGRKQ